MWLKSFILEPTSLLGGDPRACQRLTTCIWQLGRLNCFQCTKPPGSYISSKSPSNDILIPTFPDCSTSSTKAHTLYICELTVIQHPNSKLIQKVCEMACARKTRARVNKYLDELKSLIANTLQPESIARLTKADVLELTVTHLKKLQSRNQPTIKPIPSGQDKFRGGRCRCVS